ncbi:MAG: hypothetical protein HYS40_08990 [Gemmatimonadetes bacterium]|nr:hypothetical protein [Gemmatimonadota bacterium]
MPRLRPRATWLLSAGLHVAAVILAFTVSWQAPWRTGYVVIAPPSELPELPPYGGTRARRGPPGGLGRLAPAAEVPAETREPAAPPSGARDTAPAGPAPEWGPLVPGPQLGDGRLWVSPRPALPASIAEQLYGTVDSLERDAAVVARLRAMVDTLNRALDEEQRAHRLPSWTVRGDSGDPQWGLDPRNIYIAGIKIPTAALALLGNLLPQGNYDEGLRARALQGMREDLLRSAQRAENFQQFKRYVRELRERKQAERDVQRRARGDTARVTP